MSAEAVQATVTIEPVTCGSCGMWFGIDATMLSRLRRDGDWFWCPRGCKIHYYESEAQKLKRELEANERALEAERQARNRERNLRDHYKRSAQTYRGHLTRVRRRVGNGVCPCCNRTFKQLAEHMQRQHPEYGKPVERVK